MSGSTEFVAVELVRPNVKGFACSYTGPRCSVSLGEDLTSSDDELLIPQRASARALNSSCSFSRGLLAGFDVGPSPIETPAESRTAASTPNVDEGEKISPATAHSRARVAPLQRERFIDVLTPAEEGARTAAATPDCESPVRVLSVRRFESGLASSKHPRSLKFGPSVKCPKHAWSTPAGFAALVKALPAGLESGEFFMRLSDDGAGGTYFVYSSHDATGAAPLAVFKPAAQEVGAPENPRGNDDVDDDARFEVFAPGMGYAREVLAFELDHGHFAGVPPTVELEIHGEVGSLQRFVPRMMQSWSTTPAKFDAAAVHRIAVFDLRTLNCDRHGGNLLVRKDAPDVGMVPIDHGFILPEAWSDPDFEWALWPQAKLPVSDAVREYVAALDATKDAALVRARLGEGPAEVIGVTTRLLQCALAKGKAYTLRHVADFCRRPSLTEPSGLEQVMTQCRRDLDEGGDIDFAAVEAALQRHFP